MDAGARIGSQIAAASKVLATMRPIDPEGVPIVEEAQAKRILIGVVGVSELSEANKSLNE